MLGLKSTKKKTDLPDRAKGGKQKPRREGARGEKKKGSPEDKMFKKPRWP